MKNKNNKEMTPHNILVSGTPDPNLPCPKYISPFRKEKEELDIISNKRRK